MSKRYIFHISPKYFWHVSQTWLKYSTHYFYQISLKLSAKSLTTASNFSYNCLKLLLQLSQTSLTIASNFSYNYLKLLLQLPQTSLTAASNFSYNYLKLLQIFCDFLHILPEFSSNFAQNLLLHPSKFSRFSVNFLQIFLKTAECGRILKDVKQTTKNYWITSRFRLEQLKRELSRIKRTNRSILVTFRENTEKILSQYPGFVN